MALSRRDLRANVGKKLGIVYAGTSTTTPTDLTMIDVNAASPFDPGDTATRFNGAGLLLDDATNLKYKTNVTYDPTTQKLTWVGNVTLADTIYYEVHTEPLLNPLTLWPDLIDDALIMIRRIAWKHILLKSHRGYYDLTQYSDVDLTSRVRRLYCMGPNILQNADFLQWPTGTALPQWWLTANSAIPTKTAVLNYPNGASIATGKSIYQVMPIGVGSRRVKVSVWATTDNAATATVTLATYLTDGSVERTTNITQAVSLTGQLELEIETTAMTTGVRLTLASAGGTTLFWAPMAYDLSRGVRQRVQPLTTLQADGTTRMYIPRTEGCGQLALLLPYATLGSVATHAADIATTTAPPELIEAAVAVQVLRFLAQYPALPLTARQEYGLALRVWDDHFAVQLREHVRKLTKSASMWEAGELN